MWNNQKQQKIVFPCVKPVIWLFIHALSSPLEKEAPGQ